MTYVEKLFGLSGKVALVTGASRGIGQHAAVGLAKAGAAVALVSRSSAAETVKMIEEEGGRALYVPADVTKEAEVDAALAQVLDRFGSLDIVFNNAGVCIHKSSLETTIEEFREVIDVNLTGEYIVARAAGRIMTGRGIRGSIINMSSMCAGIVVMPQWQCSYNASKAAVNQMTKSLAVEWAPHGIRVNSLSPGYIATPMATDSPQDMIEAWLPLIPMRRMAVPEELMTAVLYLASDASSYTSGSDVLVDGGYSCP